jgi:hypothetical protein
MDFRDKGVQTQLGNIEAQTGRTLAELKAEVEGFGALKYGERRGRLQDRFGLSHVHADTLLLWIADGDAPAPQIGEAIATIYAGAKAHLRPVHDALVAALSEWGPFEMAPKKGYVSLRLTRQFCMAGPATNARVAIGINERQLTPTERLRALPPGKLCPFEVSVTTASEIDAQLLGWIRSSWDRAH